LGRRDHSTRELEVKLLARTDDASAVAGVLDRLKAGGYLDDRQCIETLAAVRLRRGDSGRSRLQREMAARGLPRELVNQVLNEMFPPDEELNHMLRSLERKLKSLPEPLDEKRLVRLYNYLLGRGFPPEAVRREIRKRFPRPVEWGD
jgi:regulatory protein